MNLTLQQTKLTTLNPNITKQQCKLYKSQQYKNQVIARLAITKHVNILREESSTILMLCANDLFNQDVASNVMWRTSSFHKSGYDQTEVQKTSLQHNNLKNNVIIKEAMFHKGLNR